MNTLATKYQTEIRSALKKEFSIDNDMAVAELKKITLNIGLGEALANKKVIETMLEQMTAISGQRPVVTKARHDIATFKVRKGDSIGIKVTLRGDRMYQFVDKLVKIVLPRIRDFRGIPETSFDGKGTYSLGLKEQIVFHEIDYSTIDKIRGLEVIFTTTGKNTEQTMRLLELLGMPFRKAKQAK